MASQIAAVARLARRYLPTLSLLVALLEDERVWLAVLAADLAVADPGQRLHAPLNATDPWYRSGVGATEPLKSGDVVRELTTATSLVVEVANG